jgi:DNA-binding transcriptional ArsR family regulator
MNADAQVAPVAALLADRARSAMLLSLADGRVRPACDLALAARVTPQTASTHLARLVDGGLLAVEKRGRHRFYRLARPEVAVLLEALATVAPVAPARSFREGQDGRAVRFARSCYDHLAGRVGVEVLAALVTRGWLRPGGRERYEVTPVGKARFRRLGVDPEEARASRRVFARACLDWSERKPHLAGALGAALLDRLLALQWLERVPDGRALRLRARGREGLARSFGVQVQGAEKDGDAQR